MAAYIGKRLGYSLVTLVVVLIFVFFLMHLIPGDPARIRLGLRATPETVEALRQQLGLDRSLFTQFGIFLGDAVKGDFGNSFKFETSASSLVLERLPATLFLIAYVAAFAVVISVPLGVIAALRRERPVDHAIRLGVLIAISIPTFWLGAILIIVFSLRLGWFPAAGYGDGFGQHLESLFLPALAMSPWLVAFLTRNLRSAVIDVMRLPYVDFARMRGLRDSTVLRRHILRNSLTSTVTLLGVNVAILLSGSVVIENVFSIPGTGSLLLDAVQSRDYTVVQATTLIYALLVIGINLVTDLLYPVLDPRVRLQ